MSRARVVMQGLPVELRYFLRRPPASPVASRRGEASHAIRRLRDEITGGATLTHSTSSLAQTAAASHGSTGAAAKFLCAVGLAVPPSTAMRGQSTAEELATRTDTPAELSIAVRQSAEDAVLALLRCGDDLGTAQRKVSHIMDSPTARHSRFEVSASERVRGCALSNVCDRLLNDMHLSTSEPFPCSSATGSWFRNVGRTGIWLPQQHARRRAAGQLLASGYSLASSLAAERVRASAGSLRSVLRFGALAADPCLVEDALMSLAESGASLSVDDLTVSMFGCSRGFDVERVERVVQVFSRRLRLTAGVGSAELSDENLTSWTRLTRVCCIANSAVTVDMVSSVAQELQDVVSTDRFCPGPKDAVFELLVAAAVAVLVAMARCHDRTRGSPHHEVEQDALLHCLLENCRSELLEHPAVVEACAKLFGGRRDDRAISLAAHYLKRSNRQHHSVTGLVDVLVRCPSASDAARNIDIAFRRGTRLPPSVLNCVVLRDDLPVSHGMAVLAMNDEYGVSNERAGTLACLCALRSLAGTPHPSPVAVASVVSDLLSFLAKSPERTPHVVSTHQAMSLCIHLRGIAASVETSTVEVSDALVAFDKLLLQGTETLELQWLVRRKCITLLAYRSAMKSVEFVFVDDAWIASLVDMCRPEKFCAALLRLRLTEMSKNLLHCRNASTSTSPKAVMLLLDQFCALDQCLRIALVRRSDASSHTVAADLWDGCQVADATLSAHVRLAATHEGADLSRCMVVPNPRYVNAGTAELPRLCRGAPRYVPHLDPCLPLDAFEALAAETACPENGGAVTVGDEPRGRAPSCNNLPADFFVTQV